MNRMSRLAALLVAGTTALAVISAPALARGGHFGGGGHLGGGGGHFGGGGMHFGGGGWRGGGGGWGGAGWAGLGAGLALGALGAYAYDPYAYGYGYDYPYYGDYGYTYVPPLAAAWRIAKRTSGRTTQAPECIWATTAAIIRARDETLLVRWRNLLHTEPGPMRDSPLNDSSVVLSDLLLCAAGLTPAAV